MQIIHGSSVIFMGTVFHLGFFDDLELSAFVREEFRDLMKERKSNFKGDIDFLKFLTLVYTT